MSSVSALRVLVVDDEPVARRGVRALIAQWPAFEIIGESHDGEAAVEAIRTLEPDVVLLDVEMPGLDGLGVVRAVGVEHMPLTIFLTAYDRYAVPAFDVSAIDYVVKPIAEARLHAALERAMDRYRTSRRYLTRLVAHVGRRSTLIPVTEIAWIEADGYYVRVHTARTRHLVRRPLRILERQLDPTQFVRVHRSAIIRLSAVDQIERRDNRLVIHVQGGGTIVASRARRAAVLAALDT